MLETGLRAILYHRREVFNKIEKPDFSVRKTINALYNRLENELEVRIGRSTGANNYDDLFEIILGERLSKLSLIPPIWESVVILFHFRNVIAHGREISARLKLIRREPETEWEENYSGGYKKTEEYLIKKELILEKFVESKKAAIYFSDEVADHFWEISKDFLKRISDSLDGDEKEEFDSAVFATNSK